MTTDPEYMDDLFTPLSEGEIELLDRFLLDRIDEDAETLDRDEGILNISELDGFLTAIVSGPIAIPPSEWLPEVWGEFEPDWESEELFIAVISMLMRHMNGIANTLMESPLDFEPLFLERIVDNRSYTIVDEWCEGYLRGLNLSPEPWHAGGEEMIKLLSPIYAFTGVTDWRGHDGSEQDREDIQRTIPAKVREIHAYWLSRRTEEPLEAAATPFKHSEIHVGRNDPCPCGSGKKYKKCCLH